MFKIEEIKNKKNWQEFLQNSKIQFYPYFQSWNWGEVQKVMGHTIWRLGVYKDEKLVAICQIVDINAKRGHYFHLRHAPVLIPFDQEVFDLILEYTKKLAKEKKVLFIRLSPVVKKELVDMKILKKRGFVSAPIHNMDAEICWVLDIDKSDEELLKEMRKTHRYLIKKAQTMNIEIIRTNKVSDIDDFLKLYSDLSERKHFVPHRALKEEFSEFAKDDEAMLFMAKYQNNIIAGAFVSYVGKMAIYRHGASDSTHRDIPASYLLQWEAIKEAKRRGKELYNFWGIAESDNKKHPWYGLTLFKMGFGGQKEEFLHAQDLPLSPMYGKTYIIDSITKWRKGY